MNKIAAYQVAIDSNPLWQKEANLLGGVSGFGKSMATAAKSSLKDLTRSGAAKKRWFKDEYSLTNKAGLGDTAKFYGSKALGAAGRFIESNPGAATAIGVGVPATAGIGLGLRSRD